MWGLVPMSSNLGVRGGLHPRQVASPSQGNTEDKQPCTHKGNLEGPINLTVMFWDSGRKPEYHVCTGRICKLYAERTQDLLATRQQCYQLRHCAALFLKCQSVSTAHSIVGRGRAGAYLQQSTG
ncbi:hypothetical protein ILYODFUR_024329 [Ilyodon furcidens]|uniref:Uncharacterized protein n=1 Tax=Ilyodon furcidens TaxID=33524 RepID=A0ABV0VJF9_9TELE